MITLTREETQNVLNLLILWLDEQEEPDTETAIETLRAKLSEPEPEPVAIVQQEAIGKGQVLWVTPASQVQDGTPLYTAPPQREWIGLTQEEVGVLTVLVQTMGGISTLGMYRILEKALKEKNT